jgi:uncharacterized protein (DUF2141 family)
MRIAPLTLTLLTLACSSSLVASGPDAASMRPAPYAAGGSESTLTIAISGCRNDKGLVIVALFNASSENAFPKKEASYREARAKIAGGTAVIRFSDLPRGLYALSALHDEDGNGDMNTGFLGIPSEGYAFSNNPRLRMGPPKFKEACFAVDRDVQECALSMKYF